MGFFDWVGEQFSRATTAAGNTANWIGDGITHPGEAIGAAAQRVVNIPSWYEAQSHGFNSVEAYQDHLAKQPSSGGNFGTGNPTIDSWLNAAGGIGVGASYGLGPNASSGVHTGMDAPSNALAPRDINGQADAAIAAQGATMPNVAMPTNPNGASIGNNSYDFRTEPTNQIGEQRIDLVHPESTIRPTSLGLSPIDVGQPGADSNAASWDATKHTIGPTVPLHGPGSPDWNANSPDNTAAGGSTYKDPNVNAQTGGGDYAGPALSLLGAGVGALTNLKNGADISQAEKDAAEAQAKGYKDALAQNQAQFDKTQANIKPWLDAGAAALPKLESFDAEHPRGNFTESPDYAFRLSEGLKALRNTAGAQGSLVSGETMKAATNYAGNSASQEYGNWDARQENHRNSDRGALQSLAGIGQSAMGQSNAAAQNFGANQSAATVGMANALAGGTVGAANANASGYQSGAQTLMGGINSAIQMYQGDQQYKNLLAMINRNKTT